ncbi:MAG: hypothetical protein EHM85_15120 [Desulfobacteraceae bacterium]|nr:MAG: hypothetical protein EHM85_15120 [Desulfobacteraceae bacterium]
MDEKLGHKKNSGKSTVSRKIIPITELRYFYKSLSELRLSTITQLQIVEDITRKENFTKLISWYNESKKHFAEKYENSEESFLPDDLSHRRSLSINDKAISSTQDVISVFNEKQKEDGLIHVKVEDDHNYDFCYIEREVSPYRTTNSEFVTGKSGKSSGTGGVDFIGWNPTKKLPILGEIKVGGDQNPFYALIQLLTYLSELSTPNQIKRINKYKLFGNIPDLTHETSFYLYILLVNKDPFKIKKGILSKTQKLAADLKKPAIPEIEKIVFLNMNSKTKEILKI